MWKHYCQFALSFALWVVGFPDVRGADAWFPPIDVFVPQAGQIREGNSSSMLPYFRRVADGSPYRGPTRYQQVYGATDFHALPSSGALLIGITFRNDCVRNEFNVVSSNLTFTLSTSSRGPDNLSPTFAENRGADGTVVFSAASVDFPHGFDLCGDRPDWRFTAGFPVNPQFFYRPSRGNLVVEIQCAGLADFWPAFNWRPVLIDAEDSVGDAVSSQFSFSLTNRTAEVIETKGLATRFLFTPIPFIRVTNETNNIILTWPTYVPVVLQSKLKLQSPSAWQSVTNETEKFGGSELLVLPQQSLTGSRYFRLFWNSPQPGIENLLPPSPGLVIESSAASTPSPNVTP